ncbi:MAG: DUF3052 domain-containing protein [Alphaproteobacteria bacterium]|uniref:DUF3052 domain-containing protein n=1 Tax=Maricaulis alexandrii TaxID=2570354 RepID=UPI001108E004|nr:DUF3052 domain-containing protein [Maricaulis alexandrii]MCR9266516.1 DUF3052 domain-containing protein [Alphaproteobacteria bacterium]
MAATAGYSGTPLPKKLGLKDGLKVAFLGLPAEHDDLRSAALFAEQKSSAEPGDGLDYVHYFTKLRSDFETDLPRLRSAIQPAGMIWVSWPKKASKVETDMTEDVIRDVALPIDLVDVKVCAVDEVWSGLKLMIPRDKRAVN